MSKRVNETLDFGSSSAKIINLPTPVSGGDAANKAYVDAIPAALKFIEAPVRAATTGNINLSAPGATIDGVALTSGDVRDGRFLAWQQSTPSQNGTYIWNGAATPATRTGDVFQSGSVVFSNEEGATLGQIGFILSTPNPIVLGTTALTFVPGFRVISVGTGLSQSGNVISLTSPVAIALGGTNATTAAGALAALGAAIPNSAQFGNGVLTSFTFAAFKSITPYPIVKVYNASSGAEEDASVTITPGSPSGGVYTPSIVVTAEDWVTTPPSTNAYYITVVG